MEALAFTTERDAVNIMLGTIGEFPISTLAADQEMVDVAAAANDSATNGSRA